MQCVGAWCDGADVGIVWSGEKRERVWLMPGMR